MEENQAIAVVFAGAVGASISSSLVVGLVASLIVLGLWQASIHGYLGRAWNWIKSLFFTAKEPSQFDMYDMLVGFGDTGTPQVENLATVGHMLFVGTTGFGKTVWAQGLIDWLAKTHDPKHLRIAISDAKQTSFTIWGGLPHLFCPIAGTPDETERMLDLLLAEMDDRIAKFKLYANRYLCENIADYHRLSGVLLPRIVVLLDEKADSIAAGTTADAKLTRLARLSRAYGFTLIIGTQRPEAANIPGALLSQLTSKFCAFMPNSREYGVVTMIPKELYRDMTPTPGRFMVYTPRGQWRFMQSKKVPNRELETRAKALSRGGQPRQWKVEEATADPLAEVVEFTGSEAVKIAMIQAWANTLDKPPRVRDIMERYNITKPTAIKFNRLALKKVK